MEFATNAFINFMSYEGMRVFSAESQPAITCSKLTIETLEQGVKYVQS